MKPALRIIILCLSLLTATNSIAYAASWPMKEAVDLSSGFGDFRDGRFHAGVDLRTGGVTGKRVFAPVDGYVSRIRMSYGGYGKGLYFTGNDGYLYIFGHLNGFTSSLERIVKSRQVAQQRYYVDIDFLPDSVAFKQGDLLAFSGQTGAGAPHLHFEKRTADNKPLNPLTHGFRIKDKVKPFVTRIGFEQTDDHSLFLDGQRRMFFDVTSRGNGRYQFDHVLYFNAPFGVLVDCFDRMRNGGMRQAVYDLSLYVDGELYYQVTLDTVDYNTTKSADLIYDFHEASDGETRVRRLYARVGNEYAGTRAHSGNNGVIGAGSGLAFGRHNCRVVATDAFGNSSELLFRFYWGPKSDLYTFDSSVVKSDTNTVYFFTPHPDIRSMNIEEVVVQLNRGDAWGVPPGILVSPLPDGTLQASAFGERLERYTFRLVAVTMDSCDIVHMPFSGLITRNLKPVKVRHELTDDGLIVVAESRANFSYPMHVELYYRDSLLGKEPMRAFFTMALYRVFIPPRPQYQRIDKIVVRMGGESAKMENAEADLVLLQLGTDSLQFALDDWFAVTVGPDDVYEPRFIEFKKHTIADRSTLRMNSDHYEILPENVLLKGGVRVELKTVPTGSLLPFTALYRLDKEENRWDWVGGWAGPPASYAGTTRRGGSFALVYDDIPPVISELSVFEGQTIRNLQPTITFKVTDDVSGMGDDRSFNITIDGVWQIPEFDSERNVCSFTPVTPLRKGQHTLIIDVQDQIGNKRRERLIFDVVPAPKQKKGT